eukprot:3524490-Pyramimonas_sp.AAC.1
MVLARAGPKLGLGAAVDVLEQRVKDVHVRVTSELLAIKLPGVLPSVADYSRWEGPLARPLRRPTE